MTMAADYVEETTTSIAGTSGDGAVTTSTSTGYPRFSTVFGAGARTVRYIIEDIVNKKYEQGLGVMNSNVLTRTRPQITWDGTTWKDGKTGAVTALQFGSTPTIGNIIVRMGATAQNQSPIVDSFQTVVVGDTVWRDYPISSIMSGDNNGAGTTALTSDRENYAYYPLNSAGLLTAIQFEVVTSSASSNLKLCLYELGTNGLPGNKIVNFNTISTATTGTKTDSTNSTWSTSGPVWLTPGWYVIGFIGNDSTVVIRHSNPSNIKYPTPLGKNGGYGYGAGCWVAGSYAAGMPSLPSLGSGTMYSARADNPGSAWIGLKVVA
jgi:hypothetical protein